MNINEMREIIKCAKSLTYFAEKCKIVNHQKGVMDMKLYPKQKEILETYEKNNFVILQKTRQTGSSTLNEITALWHAIIRENQTIVIMTNKLDVSWGMIQSITEIYKRLPSYLQTSIKRQTAAEIVFDNNSIIKIVSSNPDSLRGYAVNLLIVDEAAYFNNNKFENMFKSNFPCLEAGCGKMIICSTKNILNKNTNYFWKLWCDSIDGNNKFKPIWCEWTSVPYRDENWKNKMLKDLGVIGFEKEYEISYTKPNAFKHIDGKRTYTSKEFAKLFGVSTSTIARWRVKGYIKGVEISPRKFLYFDDDIQLIKTQDTLIDLLAYEISSEIDKEIIEKLDRTPERNIFKIDCGDLPQDIVQKYVNELRERLKKEQP